MVRKPRQEDSEFVASMVCIKFLRHTVSGRKRRKWGTRRRKEVGERRRGEEEDEITTQSRLRQPTNVERWLIKQSDLLDERAKSSYEGIKTGWLWVPPPHLCKPVCLGVASPFQFSNFLSFLVSVHNICSGSVIRKSRSIYLPRGVCPREHSWLYLSNRGSLCCG